MSLLGVIIISQPSDISAQGMTGSLRLMLYGKICLILGMNLAGARGENGKQSAS
jgi:hypothetical protein